ncbi:LIM/homeobox protein Lhx6 isoform X1 [Agelaius phoeniceus]|uniref:LIM/homeobox protein Lhx6 isoform X1 n=1 Tax=Agelaius phoeniceus TaxID=39638 RepID=UPI00405523E5
MKPGQRRAARRRGGGRDPRCRDPRGAAGPARTVRPVGAGSGGGGPGRAGPGRPLPAAPAGGAAAGAAAAGSGARRGGRPPGRGGGAPFPARPAAAPGGGAGPARFPARLPALPAAAAGRAARGHGARRRRAERGAPAPCTGAMGAGSPGALAAAPRPAPRRARVPRARPAHGAAASLSRSLHQGDAAGAAAQGERPLSGPALPSHVAARRGASAWSPGEGGRPLSAQHPFHAVRLLPAILLFLHAVGRQKRLLQLRAGDSRPVPAEGEQPHLARPVPGVLRVPYLAAPATQLLHQEQGDLLQDGLLQPVRYQVCPLWPADLRQRLGAAGAGQCLPPGLLRLLLLQEAALHGRGVRPGGGEGAVPDPLRHHDREPEARGGEWQWDHAGGGCALGAGQPAQASQESPHLLHGRAAAGDAGTVCSGQQPRRTNAAEAGGHDGAEPQSHSGLVSKLQSSP